MHMHPRVIELPNITCYPFATGRRVTSPALAFISQLSGIYLACIWHLSGMGSTVLLRPVFHLQGACYRSQSVSFSRYFIHSHFFVTLGSCEIACIPATMKPRPTYQYEQVFSCASCYLGLQRCGHLPRTNLGTYQKGDVAVW